jgi:hypothetical protein
VQPAGASSGAASRISIAHAATNASPSQSATAS